MSTLSQQQMDAAHRIGQDVCVVAGPGSGKTSVLIERFSWLVKERGIKANRILAITFTDKAATEIKQRLVKAFANEPEIRATIEKAYVSTIHSFCTRLLRENAIEAGVDPQFVVLERTESDRLLQDVTDSVLETKYQTEPEKMRRFLRSLAVATERDGFVPDLAQSLMDIYAGLRVADRKPEDISLEPLAPPDEWSRLQKLLQDVLADNPRPATAAKREGHDEFNEWARSVLDAGLTASDETFRRLAKDKINKNKLCPGSVAHTHRDEIFALLEPVRSWLLLEYYAAERRFILEALQQIDQQYRAQKRAISGLDFDDLEEQAISLLESDAVLRERVQRGFDYILMDELQDTNPLQWKLMELVRQPDRFFAVGDVNQSIFGFRHADPELFHGYRNRLEVAGRQVDELRANYRSRAAVLDAVNTTFQQPAPDGVEEHTLIAAGTRFDHKDGPSIETIIAKGERTDDAQGLEALWIAKRIHEMVPSEPSVPSVRFGDIAILTRSNAATDELQSALDQFGIPAIVLGGRTFYETREVRDLILLLEVLVNPRNEVALAGLLRSPLCGLTDEQILRLTMRGTLSEAIEDEPPAFWESMRELRRLRDLISPDQLLRRAVDESDYESGLTARARANVEKFLAQLRSQYATRPGPLSTTLDRVLNAPPDAEAPPAEFGDAVRLMTIHKSKGLEFPRVFLPFLHARPNSGFPIVSYSHKDGLGVKWRDPSTRDGVGDSIWKRNQQSYIRASEAEENRLLYVAMTRAKDHMVLSYSITDRPRHSPWRELLKVRLQIDETAAHDTPPEIPKVERSSTEQAAAFVDPPLTPEQHDSSESATSISLFQQCPRKYYLTRYLRWEGKGPALTEESDYPERDDGQLDASELGTQVHAILAGQLVQEPAPEAVELADRFRISQLGKRAEKSLSKGHENDFVMAIDDLVLRGQIDLWFEHNRELILVDYKTDHVPANVPPSRVAPYELQLRIYAMALERMLGRYPDRAYLYFLRPNEAVEVDIGPLQLGSAQEAVRQFLDAQDRMDFPLRQGEHCLRCPHYGGMCPAGRSVEEEAPHAHRN